MRKIMYLLVLILTLSLGSCTTSAQVDYGYGYYDYERPTVTIVYRNSMPYYCIWDEIARTWTYRLVPRERVRFIRHGYRPIYRNESRVVHQHRQHFDRGVQRHVPHQNHVRHNGHQDHRPRR